jgi:hypothetical protein
MDTRCSADGLVAVAGLHVHVSDASPRGFLGWVIAVHPGALTVAREDDGAWELVHLSRRRVRAVEPSATVSAVRNPSFAG